MPKFLRISDERTLFFRWSVTNETLSCQLSLCQLVIVLVSLAQHIYSIVRHDHIFLCQFNRTAHPDEYSGFLAYDIIIFDFGLFHKILGVQTCIANYIDGGYMRCMWCVGQTMAICVLLAVPCLVRRPPPWFLWPVLTIESVYCIGLVIFTIAITDKLVHAILHDLTGHLVWLALIYWLGAATNCFLDYVLWHFYWHMEEEYKTVNNTRTYLVNGENKNGRLEINEKRREENGEKDPLLVDEQRLKLKDVVVENYGSWNMRKKCSVEPVDV